MVVIHQLSQARRNSVWMSFVVHQSIQFLALAKDGGHSSAEPSET